MRAFKSLIIAFSLFSKVPVPSFKWDERDMQYAFIFFPWIGALIGGLLMLWDWVCRSFSIGQPAFVLIGCALPIIVTGGFHVDGYMDTMDALKSYKGREDRLEILKDPHIGAFSVIMLVLYGLIFVAAFFEMDASLIPVFAVGFFLSRTLSGFAAVTVKNARGEGILFTFSSSAGRAPAVVRSFLVIQFLAAGALMVWLNPIAGSACVAGALLTYIYYIYKSKKELSGITGDTEGWFVCICEAVLALILAVYSIVIR